MPSCSSPPFGEPFHSAQCVPAGAYRRSVAPFVPRLCGRVSGVLFLGVQAGDGAEALDYLFGTGPHAGRDLTVMPQVTLLDLKLPKVDGLEVLRRLRANELTRLLPVVILTSSNEEQDRVNGYGLGANSYVRKPIDFGQFMNAVRQLGLYWLILNEPAPTTRRAI